MIKCDFCSAPLEESKAHRFPCKDFTYTGINFIGDWAGCDTCAPMVDEGKWNDLLARSVATEPTPMPSKFKMLWIELLHQKFRENRK